MGAIALKHRYFAAQTLGGDLAEVVTYDHRMIAAARKLSLKVASPT